MAVPSSDQADDLLLGRALRRFIVERDIDLLPDELAAVLRVFGWKPLSERP